MGKDILTSLRPAIVMALLFGALLGLGYPLAMTGIGQMLFPAQANGSLLRQEGRVIGSSLIGQNFSEPRYFHPRPSVAGKGYDALASSGSNLGPTSQALTDRVRADVATLHRNTSDLFVPSDLATTSASGLDPHISPEAAFYQLDRVARARNMAPARLRGLITQSIERPLLGFLGEPRVNVLELNRRLDGIGANERP
ncbi:MULTISPECIES: potassium-transporting ATPase subunit KdpC [Sphingobium]|jgi:K+-transporting ATPase ATPase C chain|uniref:potassium-transporting ATPase subunit KdpC n=1 Tax=Sphingobium TaxID=165695 RepID=UPI000DBB8273|nr:MULTISPECIES: potassium-transporting ATPase subunit KdpC [Sphingobium]KAA9011317.1 potassium-transporting ATPase subunit KdpC [Sphingobium limneticum]MBU0931092.1 potassium-transporting ATPase subunit KdpC [Alphaproteobacteria bacterium]BBD00386.1 K+-transporting ATPase ATPase C chain [Sphingobium sp. YG1]